MPPKFIISEIMPTGLHMLAGSPKVGKSWLVLWLCDQIAKGEKVWEYDTLKSNVLYLSLEDTYDRLHHRLASITEQSTENVNLAIKSFSIETGLISQLEDYMKDNPSTSLIAIDTFQLVRGDENRISYANDYQEISKLKQFADKYNIAVLLVHHLRKMQDNDPVNMISGSTGVTGGSDNVYVLAKDKRLDNTATLSITGRDVPDMAFKLEFDRENNVWDFVDHITEEEDSTKELLYTIETLIRLKGDFTGSATELIEALKGINYEANIPKNRITNIINRNVITLENTFNISYEYKRTGKKRELILKHKEKNDTKNE